MAGIADAAGIVGRGDELEALRHLLEEGRRAPVALFIEGGPGIGKTTLWRHAVGAAREGGYRVLACSPSEAEAQLALTGVRDLLEGGFDELEGELPPPQRRALAVALLREDAEGAAPRPGVIGAAFLTALRLLSGQGPLLVAVDDVQWLDPASRQILAFALRRLDTEPVAVLLAERAEDRVPIDLGLDRALPPGRVRRIRAEPLSLGAIHQILNDRLGLVLPRPILRRLYELSGGNPLFALELGRAVEGLEGRLEPGQPLPVPDELRGLIAERLAKLPRRTREALAVVAALSHPTVRLVDRATQGDGDTLLEPAFSERIVELDGDRLRFTHPLLAPAAYGDLSPRRRAELHARLARLVSDPEERAHHLALATRGSDEEVARALDEASRSAAARGAPDAAADLCARSRLLTPQADIEAIRRRSVREAEYAMESGDTPRARRVLEAALPISPPGPPRAEVLMTLARVYFNGLDWRSSVRFLERALVEAGEDVELLAQIELHLALNLDLLRTDVNETLAHARAAVDLAERLGDSASLAEALALQAKNEFLLGGPWPQALLDRALELEPAMAGLPPDRWPSDYMASMLAWTDDLEGALQGLRNVEARSLEHGDEVSLVWTLARVAEVECRTGAWADALEHIEGGYEIALDAGQTANQAIFLATRALVEAHLGVAESAREAGEAAVRLAETTGAVMARRIALSALGLLELSLGQPEEADIRLGPLVAETRAAGVGEPGAMRFVQDEIEALVALGRHGEAEELLAFLEERAKATGRVSALAAGDRCRGLLHAERGDLAAAADALGAALARYETLPMAFERARTQLALGQVQRRAKQRKRARETLAQALQGFDDLGARLWAEQARAELGRIGGRTATREGLTPTEQRVAELAAEGRSNQEIAAALYVTQKTVEFHLRNVYAKLGVRSRAQLARHVASPAEAGGD